MLTLARLEHDRRIAEPPSLVLERLEDPPAEAPPARLGRDVHPLQLGARRVETAEPAAGERALLQPADDEDPVGRTEGRRVARRADVADAAVAAAELRLLRVDERRHARRVERLGADARLGAGVRPRRHRTQRRAAPL
jgi:hypothetical protein